MSLARYVLDYVNDLKWPVFAGAVVYWLREPLRTVADRVSTSPKGSVKGLGFDIAWENALREADAAIEAATAEAKGESKAEADTGGEESSDGKRPDQTDTNRATRPAAVDEWQTIFGLVDSVPAGAVLLAYAKVEQVIKELAEAAGVVDTYHKSPFALARAIELPPYAVEAIRGLGRLRNEVAHHAAQPDPEMAREYTESAEQLWEYLILDLGRRAKRPDSPVGPV